MTTIRHYRGLDISLLVYPHRATQAGFGHNYEEGFDASIRISEPEFGMDKVRSRLFRVPGRRPFLNTGDARRACVAYAEMLIDEGRFDRAIWGPPERSGQVKPAAQARPRASGDEGFRQFDRAWSRNSRRDRALISRSLQEYE